ncbi:MAG: sugar ABC transporter permease [Lachnospiraceae bacterium]|nr:sugar ABC transporter permease [Lachnospiraceae bacterium]
MARAKKNGDIEIKRKITVKELKKQWVLLAWSAALVIYGLIFYYSPLLGLVMAFKRYKIGTTLLDAFTAEWCGFEHFQFLFSKPLFWEALRNTVCMGVINLVTSFILAITFAILLNEIKISFIKKSIQTISYLPHFLSWVIVCSIIHQAFTSKGIVNVLLGAGTNLAYDVFCGIPFVNDWFLDNNILNKFPYLFWSDENWFWPIVAFTNLWKETGWNAIIYLAAITSIDPCLYEAASIDGAGRFGKMFHITLPGIRSTVVILLLMNVGWILNAGFEMAYLLDNETIRHFSTTIDIYSLEWAIKSMNYGRGTAIGLFKSLASVSLIVIANGIAKLFGEESLF